jgi:tRNA-binding protein
MATMEDFNQLDIRVGIIVEVHNLLQMDKPFHKIIIDFGPHIGKKQSMIQFTPYYNKKEELLHKKILCIINCPPKHIGPHISEVITLTVPDKENHTILIVPEKPEASIGGKLF